MKQLQLVRGMKMQQQREHDEWRKTVNNPNLQVMLMLLLPPLMMVMLMLLLPPLMMVILMLLLLPLMMMTKMLTLLLMLLIIS